MGRDRSAGVNSLPKSEGRLRIRKILRVARAISDQQVRRIHWGTPRKRFRCTPQDFFMSGSGASAAPWLIVSMSFRLVIPRRVALLHCSPPLHQPFVMVNRVTKTVNHHFSRAGEFSTGILRNFQPELTSFRSTLKVNELLPMPGGAGRHFLSGSTCRQEHYACQ